MRKINRELRTTIIITEHRLEDIFYASDKVVVVEDGKIIADDEPRKIGDFLKNGNNDMFAGNAHTGTDLLRSKKIPGRKES